MGPGAKRWPVMDFLPRLVCRRRGHCPSRGSTSTPQVHGISHGLANWPCHDVRQRAGDTLANATNTLPIGVLGSPLGYCQYLLDLLARHVSIRAEEGIHRIVRLDGTAADPKRRGAILSLRLGGAAARVLLSRIWNRFARHVWRETAVVASKSFRLSALEVWFPCREASADLWRVLVWVPHAQRGNVVKSAPSESCALSDLLRLADDLPTPPFTLSLAIGRWLRSETAPGHFGDVSNSTTSDLRVCDFPLLEMSLLWLAAEVQACCFRCCCSSR
mmetsp:Transcript_22579/g.72262  ORF Transcript_22579/g.72262 Transcript_22579/m.72262 type:complete len:274 (+) Transcript_22579:902-1723(+)